MIKQDYWNIKPHTERKLDILSKYLASWCDIIFSYSKRNPKWTAWQTPYYVDCFSGRGMYHKDKQLNAVKGSPIIAIEKLLEKKEQLQTKFQPPINPKVRLVEFVEEWADELESFIAPYKKHLDIKVYNSDFNAVIETIVSETGSSPAFFFVDAGGIKELKRESVEKIVTKKGARDILLNYVVDGPKRIGGLGKSLINGSYKGKRVEGAIKTIEQLEDFTGMDIGKYLEQTGNENRDALINYVQSVLHSNNKIMEPSDRLTTVVYDMKDLARQRLVYYLLFSSRKSVATEIMKSIFKDSKNNEHQQMSLFAPSIVEIKDK